MVYIVTEEKDISMAITKAVIITAMVILILEVHPLKGPLLINLHSDFQYWKICSFYLHHYLFLNSLVCIHHYCY